MSISDFDSVIELDVASVSGTPTIDKSQPVYLTGDGLSGVIWVYNSWIRDGTNQLKIAHGNGPSDQQNVTGTWGNTGQNVKTIQHLQNDPITATDSSPNGNDGTVDGPVSTNGQFSSGISGDGKDDKIDFAFQPTEDFRSYSVFFKGRGTSYTDHNIIVGPNPFVGLCRFESDDKIHAYVYDGNFHQLVSTNTLNDGNWHHVFVKVDNSQGIFEMYIDGSLEDSYTFNSGDLTEATLGDASLFYNSNANERYGEVYIDEYKEYTEFKDSDWIQAEYEASAKAGQQFFLQNGSSGPVDLGSHSVNGPSDIALYDQNDNLLSYEIESLETTEGPTSGSVAQTDNSGVVQTDGDGVISTG